MSSPDQGAFMWPVAILCIAHVVITMAVGLLWQYRCRYDLCRATPKTTIWHCMASPFGLWGSRVLTALRWCFLLLFLITFLAYQFQSPTEWGSFTNFNTALLIIFYFLVSAGSIYFEVEKPPRPQHPETGWRRIYCLLIHILYEVVVSFSLLDFFSFYGGYCSAYMSSNYSLCTESTITTTEECGSGLQVCRHAMSVVAMITEICLNCLPIHTCDCPLVVVTAAAFIFWMWFLVSIGATDNYFYNCFLNLNSSLAVPRYLAGFWAFIFIFWFWAGVESIKYKYCCAGLDHVRLMRRPLTDEELAAPPAKSAPKRHGQPAAIELGDGSLPQVSPDDPELPKTR